MSKRAKRLKALAMIHGIFDLLILPIPITATMLAYRAIMAAPHATRLTVGWPSAGHALTVWASTHGYLPWYTWPTLLASRDALLVWVVLSAGLFLFMALQMWSGSRESTAEYGGPQAAGKGEHGTARWRKTAKALALSFSLWRAGQKDNPSGIFLGQGPWPGTAWILTSDQHVLVVGSPGSRKTRGLVLEGIGVIGSARKESMVISDPKGELYAHTAQWLRSQGYEIIRLDLRDPSRGNRWNPMRGAVLALAEGRNDRASALAADISHLLSGSLEGSNSDPYWRIAGEALVSSLILAVASGKPPLAEDDERWPTVEERHMASVYGALIAGGAGGGPIDEWIDQFPPNHPAFKAYGPVRLSEDKQRTSILGTAAVALQQFADEETSWLTSAQDHDLADVGRKPTAVFLVIPDERSTRYPLATLYIQQVLQALAELADQHGGKLPIGVNFLLDEFGNLPQIRDFDKTVTVSRGRGIRLMLVLQDLAQLKRHYGDAAQTIKGSMSTWVYLRTAEIETAREISQKLGQYTIAAENLSTPRVSLYTTTQTVGTSSTTQSLQGRDLLTPEEVLRWPLGHALVLQAGQLPADLPLPDLSEWRSVWPDIQERISEPESRPIEEPPTWRLGDDFAEDVPYAVPYPDDSFEEPPDSPPENDPAKEAMPDSDGSDGISW